MDEDRQKKHEQLKKWGKGKITIDDIMNLQDNGSKNDLYVRWSRGPKYDTRPSRDYQNNTTHNGLSSVFIDYWDRDQMKKRLGEYGFLRMKDEKIKPYIYRSKETIGEDTDGQPLLPLTSEFLGELEYDDKWRD